MPTDIFDEIEIDSPAKDIFDEIDYTPTGSGFGDLKVAERDLEKDTRINALLEEQKRARFDAAFNADNARTLGYAEQAVRPFTTPITGPIHAIRQATGLENPDDPRPIVPPIPKTSSEQVKNFIPDAMPGVPEAIAGIQQAAAGVGDFILNPDTIGIGGAGAAPKVIQAALGATLSGDMASHLPEQAEKFGQAIREGKGEDVVREGVMTALSALGTVAPAIHALPKSVEAVGKSLPKKPAREMSVEDFYRENPEERPSNDKPAIEIPEFEIEKPKGLDEIKTEETKTEEAVNDPREILESNSEQRGTDPSGMVVPEAVRSDSKTETTKLEESKAPDQTQRAPSVLESDPVQNRDIQPQGGTPEIARSESIKAKDISGMFGGMGGGASQGLYVSMFDRLSKGKLADPFPLNQQSKEGKIAKIAFDNGHIKNWEDIREVFNDPVGFKARTGFDPKNPLQKPPEIIGMGGAVESEFKPSGNRPTSIKNAQVDAERAERGLPPAIQSLKKTFQEAWDQAMLKMDREPNWQDDLVRELTEKPRALQDYEDAAILHRQVDLQNEQAKAMREIAQAYEDGRTHAVESAQSRLSEIDEKLQNIYDIGKYSGRETARGLNARKMFANEDFTLANLKLKKQAAKGGKPLTAEENVQIQKLADEYKAKSEALEKSNAEKDQRIAEMETQRAFEQLKREMEPSNYVIKIAEKIVKSWDKGAEAARARLKAKFARTSTGIDPTILLDVAQIGLSHLGHIGLDFIKWSAKLTEEFGDEVKPYLEDAFKLSQKLAEDEYKKHGKIHEPIVRKIINKTDTKSTVEAAKEKAASGAKIDIQDIGRRLERQFWLQGIKTRDAMLDAVHGALKEIIPTLEKEDTQAALGGYGKYKQLSKEEIDVELRDLNGQYQQLAKLDDLLKGKAAKRSGVEQRTKSDEERRIEKLVEEAKRRGGYKVTDPATQLKTSMDAIKTRLKNEISDLEHQIKTKALIVKEKRGIKYDAEAEALKARRDELKKEFEDIFGKKEMTDEQRVRNAISAVERSIAEYDRRIKEGDLFPGKKPSRTPNTPELKAARAIRDARKAELEELQELARPKLTPEERALKSDKTRTANRIAELEDKLARRDFSKKKPVEYVRDTEAIQLKYDLEKIKRKFNEELFKDKLKNRTTAQKVFGGVGEVINTARAIMTSIDLSAIRRQGGFITLSHPVTAFKALGPMFRAMKSEKGQFEVMEEIYNRPNAPFYKRDKLSITDNATSLSRMEEEFMSRIASKIPIVAGSGRAYSTFLNRLRADSYDAMARSLGENGRFTPEQGRISADYINNATGRGDLGAKDNLLVGMNTLIFAPRFVASRFNLLFGIPIWRAWREPKIRNYIIGEYARYMAGLAVVYGLAKAGGFEVNFDRNSSDFGKIKIGNTRIDVLSGLSQVIVLMSRLKSGKITKINGEEAKISRWDTMTRFGRTKLAPVPAAVVDIGEGKNVVGKKVTPLSALANAIAPMTPMEIIKAMKEHGIPEGTAIGIASVVGEGVSTYSDDKD